MANTTIDKLPEDWPSYDVQETVNDEGSSNRNGYSGNGRSKRQRPCDCGKKLKKKKARPFTKRTGAKSTGS